MEPRPDSPAPAPASAAAPAAAPASLRFEAVPVRFRRDGWTPARQRAFIAALAGCRCVLEACRRVGKSPEAAYRLYRRADAASFRAAWDAALARTPAAQPSTCSRSSTSGRTWQPSASSASSTSAPSTSADPTAPRPAGPAYSIEAFARIARRARMARLAKGKPPA